MQFRVKSLFARTGLLLSGALLLAACARPAQTGASSPALVTARTITVVGKGEATAKPDIVRINVGVEATAPTVAEAMAKANSQMSAVIGALKGTGIPDKDIRTSNFSINFERPYAPPAPGSPPAALPPGVFRVSNMVEATLREPAKAGEALDAAVKAGANTVWNVSFGLDDTEAVEAKARAEAVADARARAEDLARLNGLRLGPVVSVSTVIGSGPGPMPMVMAKQAEAGPPLETGEVSWTSQVQVVFEFASP